MIIGGLDIGTTGCKVALYNEKGENVNTYYREYSTTHINGEHEIDFRDLRNGVFELLSNAFRENIISALGVTSFGETFAMLDENDNVLAPSMLYTDSRGKEECRFLCDQLGEEYLTLKTGVKPHQMYSISKIMWLKNNKTEEYNKCKQILLGEDFIVYSLCGKAQIDYSLAARTGAFDIKTKAYIKEIFDAAGIDLSLMLKPVPSGSKAGLLKDELKNRFNIDYDVMIVNGCHDQIAAMIGSGVFEFGQAMDGTGTVECIPAVLDRKPDNLELYEGGYSVVPFLDSKYACYALSYTGGATLKWFRDNFTDKSNNIYKELDALVPEKPTDLLILPHFAGAATPYMDNDSKAAIIGLTLETTKYDIYKALMEGTSYEMLLNFNTIESITGKISEIKATGGGAHSDVWLQIKADILDAEIIALDCKEVGAMGTAALAGVSMGVYHDLKDIIKEMLKVRKVFVPNKENCLKYKEHYKKYSNLYKALKSL